jgi:tripartite-type tricarboxylate transporter receptor subunit TctC
MRFTRGVVVASLAVGGLAVLAAPPAAGQPRGGADGWPQRPIRMIIDFSAGGLSDTLVRAVGPRMSELLGQPLVMDNRPGAAGSLAYSIVAKAVPDGYTLVVLSTGFALNPSLMPKPGYDVMRDFAPIGLIGTTPNVLVAPQRVARSVSELVAYIKAKPGATNAASTGVGSTPHLTLELFRRMAGIDPVHVPFNGSGPALADLIGGRLDFMFVNLPASLGHIKGGRILALAVGSEQRSALLPDVPTMQEAGYKGFRSTSWAGIGAPHATPKVVQQRLATTLAQALEQPDVRERIAAAGAEVRAGSPEQFRAFIEDEMKRWARVVKDAGIKLEN